jgi:glycosyltransferase involved in cell wall biosynthesis
MSMKSHWHVGVAIPARNEEYLLPRCLRSIHQAREAVSGLATVDIVVVADSSTDRTLDIATKMLGSSGRAVCIHAGMVGAARAMGARLLLDRAACQLSRHWIANTDADCVVPPDWLVSQLALAEASIEAIAGIVSVDSFDEHSPETPARFRSSYTIEPGGLHPHIHGANMGVRADLYVRAGGWLPLDTAEDHDLWRRLSQKGARRLSTSCISVQTSGRRIGRAPKGFAGALASHNGNAA